MSKKSNTEEFIAKAKLSIHGEKFNYSLVNYIGCDDKVKIICKKHGEFLQTPSNHLNGNGCPTCARNNFKSNTQEFIGKAKLFYSDKFDYSKFTYIKSNIKGIIICKIHGEFKQKPNTHLNGSGCPKCKAVKTGLLKKSNTQEFITKVKQIRGDEFDYSKVNYIDALHKVIIICKKHGPFTQLPSCHLNGHGCLKCRDENTGNRCRSDINEFLEKIKTSIHKDDGYDYSLVDYVDCDTPVKIICKKHGEFKQSPYNHISAEQGCPKCSHNQPTTFEWVEMAKNAHGNKFDYSQVNYVTKKSKVIIICKKHGKFLQAPYAHIRGQGCPKCWEECYVSKPEKEWLDSLNILNEYRQYRIGEYLADGYDPKSNTIYEFYGDYFHCNPNKYSVYYENKTTGKVAFEQWIYDNERKKYIEAKGYKFISIWENDWNKYKSGNHTIPNIQ